MSLASGDKIRVHFLHPSPPSPTENEESSERDAELIIVAKSIAETDVPVIVTGDLNSELSRSGEEAWDDLKAGVDLAWEAMNEAIKSAASRLR